MFDARQHRGQLLRRGQRSEINLDDRHRLRRANALHGQTIDDGVGGAQDLMTCHQRAKARFERSDYQLAAQVQQSGEMIGNAGRFQLRQEPEPLLRIGKWCQPLLFRSPDRLERLLLVQKGQDLGFVCG